jgi:DNA-binding PadR family transcriptional regulator
MATYAFITEGVPTKRGRCNPKAGGPGGRHGGGHGGHRGRFGFDPSNYEGHGEGPGGGRGGRGGWGGPGFGGPGGRGPGGPGFFGGRGPRASRGDVRAGILALLSEEPMHGYQVMRELAERSGGVWRPSPGSIYPTLNLLQDEGLVTSEEKSGGRKLFSLTDEGREAVEARKGEKAPWDAVSQETTAPQFELRDLVFQVGAATRQVVEAGTSDQAQKAVEVLKDARRALYRILAEDEPAKADEPAKDE